MKTIFIDFIEYVKKYDKNYIFNINPNGIEFDIIKICDAKLLRNFFDDNIFINETGKFFISFLPNDLNPFISLFCCNISLNNVYDKISSVGLAIEGCFNYNKITNNISYKGYSLNGKIIDYKGLFPNDKNGYLIIQSHSNIKILNSSQINLLDLFDVQFIKGPLLYKNGIPFISLEKMKNIKNINLPDLPNTINGSNVKINYETLTISIYNKEYSFNDLDKNFSFKYPSFFKTNNGPLVIAMDKDNNIMIIYHDNMDIYNIMQILNKFNCEDAILICNTPNLNIMWKGDKENNYYNNKDFIGNPNKTVSNIILFSK